MNVRHRNLIFNTYNKTVETEAFGDQTAKGPNTAIGNADEALHTISRGCLKHEGEDEFLGRTHINMKNQSHVFGSFIVSQN